MHNTRIDVYPHTSERGAVSNVDDEARSTPDSPPSGPAFGPADGVERALAVALERAAMAGRFDVVAQLARELEARRLASSPNVVALPAKRPGR